MDYTDSQILDLIDDLHSVGQTEEPKEELKRLLKEWEIEVGVHKIQEKSPKEIADLQRYLGIQQMASSDSRPGSTWPRLRPRNSTGGCRTEESQFRF